MPAYIIILSLSFTMSQPCGQAKEGYNQTTCGRTAKLRWVLTSPSECNGLSRSTCIDERAAGRVNCIYGVPVCLKKTSEKGVSLDHTSKGI